MEIILNELLLAIKSSNPKFFLKYKGKKRKRKSLNNIFITLTTILLKTCILVSLKRQKSNRKDITKLKISNFVMFYIDFSICLENFIHFYNRLRYRFSKLEFFNITVTKYSIFSV